KVLIDYPTLEEEITIAETTTAGDLPEIQPGLTRGEILALQRTVRKVLVARSVTRDAVGLVRATRPGTGGAAEVIEKYLAYGGGAGGVPGACLGGGGGRAGGRADPTSGGGPPAPPPRRSSATAWPPASAPTATASGRTTSSRSCSR